MKKKRVSLDTNAILRLLLQDVPAQHAAIYKLFLNPRLEFSVADIAVIEVVFVLQRNYGFDRLQVSEAVNGLMQQSNIHCNRPLFQKALRIYTDKQALSFEDCCLSIYAELNGAEPLWTFDKKLANQAPNAQLIS